MALTTNLNAYYKLNESSGNAADATGNGYTLTNSNGVTYVPAVIANGADFGNANTNTSLLTTSTQGITSIASPLSWGFWLYFNTLPSSGVLYNIINLTINNASTGGHIDMRLWNNGGTQQFQFHVNTAATDNSQTYLSSFSTATWYYIVATWDGTTATIYLNASSVSSGNPAYTIGNGSTSFGFELGGDTYSVGGRFSSVRVDEVGVWTRVLSGSEITQLYNGGAGLSYPFASPTNSGFFMAASR